MAVSGVADLTGSDGVVDARLGNTGFRTSTVQVEDDNYGNINDMDTRLSALDATTYTVTYMRTMSKNDKMYALRLLRDATGVK